MTKGEEVIKMDDQLHPIGTLMYNESKEPDHSTDWKPHRNIWRVVAHRECQDFPNAPITVKCEIRLVRQEALDGN